MVRITITNKNTKEDDTIDIEEGELDKFLKKLENVTAKDSHPFRFTFGYE